MGQKVNPKGFRLITNQKHLSSWHTSKTNYANFCKEDNDIRSKIEKGLNPVLTLAETYITRLRAGIDNKEIIHAQILCLHPRSKDFLKGLLSFLQKCKIDGAGGLTSCSNLKEVCLFYLQNSIKDIAKNIQKITGKICLISLKFIYDPFDNAALIAKLICKQLEARIPFRRIIKACIKKAKALRIDGIKIQISGRLNGAEIARTEWQISGRMSLHTLRNPIMYSSEEAHCAYGTLGVKVWLNKN